MTALTTNPGGTLALADIGKSLTKNLASTPRAKTGGADFIKLDQADGSFVYGVAKYEADEDSRWLIDVRSFYHGWIAWHRKAVEDQVRVPMSVDINSVSLRENLQAQAGAQYMRGFLMVCTKGPDEGATVDYGANTQGGLDAVEVLMGEVAAQFDSGSAECFPLVALDNSHYDHREHGRIYKPVFTIESWLTSAEALGEEPEAAPKTKAKAKKKAEVEPELDLVPEEPEDTPPARKRRRAA
jgi:hypothetical protein